MTYFVVYNLFQFIKIWENITYIDKVNEYLGIIAMIVMMFETTVYLAYYKDVIFAMVTLLNYVGMYIHNFQVNSWTASGNELNEVLNIQLGMISLTSFFIVITILHDFDKAFYRQYRKFYFKFKTIESKSKGAQDPSNKGPAELQPRS